jgi:hypothetical protein
MPLHPQNLAEITSLSDSDPPLGEGLRQRLLDRAKSISQSIVERVRQVAGPDGPALDPPPPSAPGA